MTVTLIASDKSWIEQTAIDQLHQALLLPGMERVVGLPDLHAGRGIAVGAAYWSPSHIHPRLVGNDIGCGMALWQTDAPVRKFKLDAAERKLTGIEGPWDGDVAALLDAAGLSADLAANALGTIGGGNHFAELLRLEEVFDADHGLAHAHVFLMVHSGSRGLGDAVMRQYEAAPLVAGTAAASAYLADHNQALVWAELNRRLIAARIFERLGMTGERLLDIFHNSVTPHQNGWLHRKGAAPADKGMIVIPGSRGDLTYLVAPLQEGADYALHSLAHGAGRKWSRSDAKAKLGKRFKAADLERTALGSRVICEDRDLIFEEAPQAYKNIHSVIADLEEAGLIRTIASFRPLITYKTRRT